MHILIALAGFMMATTAYAQSAPVPASVPASAPVASAAPTIPVATPPTWGTRDPLALPGDNLPLSLAAVLTPPPINPNTPRISVPSPPLALALEAAQVAIAQCKTNGYDVGVAVSNSVGGMVIGIQADGAFPGRVYNAVRKNLVVLEFGTTGLVVREKLRAKDFDTLSRIKPNMTLSPGGIPLFSEGKLIGAIAVSGAPGGERDEVCAAAGAAVFNAKP